MSEPDYSGYGTRREMQLEILSLREKLAEAERRSLAHMGHRIETLDAWTDQRMRADLAEAERDAERGLRLEQAREALRQIASCPCTHPHRECGRCVTCIARAALASLEGGEEA